MAFTLLKTVPERFLMNYIASISDHREEQIFQWAQSTRDASRRKRVKKLWNHLRANLGDLEVPAEDEHVLQQALLPRGEDVQEHLVRVRMGRVRQHHLHVYGGLLHILLYPVTLSIACIYALFEGMASMRREFSSDFANKSDVPSFAFFSETFFVGTMLLLFCSIVPLCIVAVILSAPLDIILLLLRPCFSPKVRQAVVVFFFPSCLVFTVAAAVGVPTLAHCLLGALPSAATGASIHSSVDRKHYETVMAALRLCPHLDVPRTAIAREAVKGVFELKHELPGVIVWAFVFQDIQLCRAWVARFMGPVHGPDVLPAWSEASDRRNRDSDHLYPWDWFVACLLRCYDLNAVQQAISRRRHERGQLCPELRRRLQDYMGKSAIELLRGDYPDGLAEAVVKQRLGMPQRHPFHVFGGIIHVVLYPVTFLAALVDGAIAMGSDATFKVRSYLDEQKIPSYECLFNGLFFAIYGLVALLPMCIAMFCLWIALAVPYDIVILLLRPLLTSWRCQTLVHAALPSCLTFCLAARRSVWSAKIAYCLFGCLPSRYSVDFTSSPSQIVAAFRFAPYCRRRSFVESFMNTPERLAMDAAQYFVPALQRPVHASADCGPLVAWAVLLGDMEICELWEEESRKAVEITVSQISGEILWGPAQVPSFQTVSELKKQIKDESLNGEDRGRLHLLINGSDSTGDTLPRELDRDTATFLEFVDVGSLNLLLVVEKVDEEAIDDDPPVLTADGHNTPSTHSSRSSSPRTTRPLLALDNPGLARPGCNSTDVQAQLKDVHCIFPSNYAFAAVKNGGAVVSWGAEEAGGDSSAAQLYLTEGVQEVFSTNAAYAALKSDGSVVTWGLDVAGGDCSAVRMQLSDVQHIYNTASAFAARKADGSVICWGNPLCGGDTKLVHGQLTGGVVDIAATSDAFAALKVDGSVVTWGNVMTCDSFDGVKSQLSSGVGRVFANSSSFAALKEDGSVVTW